MANVKVGMRLRLVQELDFFPQCVVPEGSECVVTEISYFTVWVRFDKVVPGLERWDNEVGLAEIQYGNGDYYVGEVCVPLTD